MQASVREIETQNGHLFPNFAKVDNTKGPLLDFVGAVRLFLPIFLIFYKEYPLQYFLKFLVRKEPLASLKGFFSWWVYIRNMVRNA